MGVVYFLHQIGRTPLKHGQPVQTFARLLDTEDPSTNLHKQIVAHFQQHRVDPPFPEQLIQEFRDSLDALIPLQHKLDWQVREDQPLCLHALANLSVYMEDADQHLFLH